MYLSAPIASVAVFGSERSGIGFKTLFFLARSSSHVHPDVKHSVDSSLPHYGHSGILEAARELFMQIDGNPGDTGKEMTYFPSNLLCFVLLIILIFDNPLSHS